MAACSPVDLSAALSWLHGNKLDDHCIYGIKMVWVGRFAKVVAFIASMTLVIDILGEDKVRSASDAFSKSVNVVSEYFEERKVKLKEQGFRAAFESIGTIEAKIYILSAVLFVAWNVFPFSSFVSDLRSFAFLEAIKTAMGGMVVVLLFSGWLGFVVITIMLATTLIVQKLMTAAISFLSDGDLCTKVRIRALACIVLACFLDLFASS